MVHSSGVSDPAVRCPVHGTPAAYWHAGDDWACTIPGCGYGYGIATATSAAAAARTLRGAGSRAQEDPSGSPAAASRGPAATRRQAPAQRAVPAVNPGNSPEAVRSSRCDAPHTLVAMPAAVVGAAPGVYADPVPECPMG